MAVKVIFFDFWGTLVENGVKSPVKQVKWILRLRDMNFAEYVTKFEDVFMTKKYEDLNQGFNEVLSEFKLSVPEFVTDKLIGMWNKNTILADIYDDTIESLVDLKKDYKLVLIANTDPFSINSIIDKHDMRKLFDIVAFSYDTGFLKSNKQSFKDVLKQLKCKTDEAVMIGDSIESDVKSAENAGIVPILIDRKDGRDFDNKINSLVELRDKLQTMK